LIKDNPIKNILTEGIDKVRVHPNNNTKIPPILAEMADEIGKIPKPQMRGLLNAQIKRNLALTAVTCTLAGLYMKFIFGNGRKNVYAEYYK
jgi:hypothetical protein